MTKTNSALAFVFPGQGSQQVGMLKDSAAAFLEVQETFKEATQALGKDLWTLAQTGPEKSLNDTVNTQPALLVSGVALWRVWQAKGGALPRLLAGHSLGEYTALVCANAMSLADGVKLVAKRGQFMQEAVPVGQGAMAAILGIEDNKILQEVCDQASLGEIVSPVNFNAIGQTVIAGQVAAVERACALAKTFGAKRALMLPVSVPSHCELMRPAALALAKELEAIKISLPTFPVVHNVDVEVSNHPDDIRERLVQQLYHPVRWVETIQRFAHEGIKIAVECGPGKVLSGLIKRIDPIVTSRAIEAPSELIAALENC